MGVVEKGEKGEELLAEGRDGGRDAPIWDLRRVDRLLDTIEALAMMSVSHS